MLNDQARQNSTRLAELNGCGEEDALLLLTYQNRARTYDPAVGRFISEDPIRHESGESNLLVYVRNDPINHIDPSGHGETTEVVREGTTVVEKRIIKRLITRGLLQLHHIIQKAIFKEDTALGKWMSRIIEEDAAENLILLPTLKSGSKRIATKALDDIAEGKAAGPTAEVIAEFAKRTGHQGRHLKAYLAYQENILRDIMERNLSKQITDAEAKAEVQTLQAQLREGLEKGIIVLQKSELAQLKLGGLVLGAFGVATLMSSEARAAKEAEFGQYVNGIIENREYTKGLSVEDSFGKNKVTGVLDFFNDANLLTTAEELARAAHVARGDIDDVLQAKMVELGLIPDVRAITEAKVAYLMSAICVDKYQPDADELQFLGAHQDVQDRVIELQKLLNEKNGKPLNEADLKRMNALITPAAQEAVLDALGIHLVGP